MKAPDRRRLLRAWGAGSLLLGGVEALRASEGAAADTPREIAITAQRFRYTPADVPLRAGEPVVLVLTALDFVHGFHIPDLGVRADLIPNRAVRIPIPPLPHGIVPFLCDNFCGDGHEEMQGRLVISA